MGGFNGALPTPINANSAPGIRDTLNVPSKTEMEEAIAQSTAITSGESSIVVPSGITLYHPYLKKSGRVCSFKANVTIGSTIAGTNAIVVTLPTGFRPAEQFDFYATATYGGTKSTYTFAIKTNGEVVTATGGNTFSGSILVDVSFVI